MKPLRILHCPTIVGGNPQGLASGERALGLASRCVALKNGSFEYPCDEVLWEERDDYLAREIKRWGLLRRALCDFDIVHFNFGRSIMPHRMHAQSSGARGDDFFSGKRSARLARALYRAYSTLFSLRDLPWLKKAGKGIVVTYQGNDARQFDYCRAHFSVTFAREEECARDTEETDALKRRQIAFFARYADRIFALNPDLLYVLPSAAQFLPYAHVDPGSWRPPKDFSFNLTRPHLVHAPTNRAIKGTKYLLETLDRLKREGIDFRFTLVENCSQAAARRVYETADLLIDQLLAGWYGGLAVELMALGKPVISYIRGDDLRFIPDAMRKELPIIDAAPQTIYAVLKEWLTSRRSELPRRGESSRAYVERWHDPRCIAQRLQKEYEAIARSRRCSR